MNILKKFAAAAREIVLWANEWRDSFFYTGLAAYTANGLINGDLTPLLDYAIPAAGARELLRSYTWENHENRAIAGINTKDINPEERAAASFIVSGAFAVIYLLQVSLTTLFLPATVLAAVSASIEKAYYSSFRSRYGGLSRIRDLYFNPENGMWDWPRKDNGGGPTRSQRAADYIMKKLFGHVASHAFEPAPKLQTVPARNDAALAHPCRSTSPSLSRR